MTTLRPYDRSPLQQDIREQQKEKPGEGGICMHTMRTQPALETPAKVSPARFFSETYPPRVLPPLLGARDLTALFLLNVFWVTNVTPLAAGGTASFTYWMIGGTLFFIPCSLV